MIQLGDLIVKAGLRYEDGAVILGALVDATERLRNEAERTRLAEIGKATFNNDSKELDAADHSGSIDGRNGPRPSGD